MGVLPDAYLKTTLWENRKCYIINLFVAFGTLQFGFDSGIIAGFQAQPSFLLQFGYRNQAGALAIHTLFQQLISSLPYVGQIASQLILAYTSQYYGRKTSLRAGCLIGVMSLILQIFATNEATVLAGRFFLGFSNMLFYSLSITYSAETAPPHLRSTMGQVYQTFTGIGVIFGSIVSNSYKAALTRRAYQIQCVYCLMIPAGLFVYTFFIPESPRWLAVKGKKDNALQSLRRLRGNGVAAQYVNEEFDLIAENVALERELSSDNSWMDMWRGSDRRRTLLSIACACLFTSTGAPYLSGYATYFFKVTGQKDPFLATILAKGVALTVGGFIGLYLTMRVDRRKLLLGAYIGCLCSMVLMSVPYTVDKSTTAAKNSIVAAVAIFEAFYGAAAAPVGWILAAEIPSNRLRAKTFPIAMACCGFANWLVVFTAPYFINPERLAWGAKYGFIWVGSTFIALVFIYFCIPETRNRSLEELQELFDQRIPARKFAGYTCTRRGAAEVSDDVKADSQAVDGSIEKLNMGQV